MLAAALRFWSLPDQPVLYFDSGQYLGEARFLSSAARVGGAALFSSGSGNPLERVVRAVDQGTEAHAPDNAKVGHAILLATSMLVFGTTAFSAVLVSAVAALGTVAATYAIGVLGWGRRVGIPAALMLAISGWHLTYSREAYAEADMVLFTTLAYLVYLHGLTPSPRAGFSGSLVWNGVLFGLAFACNTRAAYALLVLVPTEVLLWRLRGWARWAPTLRRGLALASGLVAPLIVIEGAYLATRFVAGGFGASAAWPDYAQQIAAYLQQHPLIIRFDQWPSFFTYLWFMDGALMLVLLLIGVVWTSVRPKRPADVLLLTALLMPVLLYSVYVAGAVRMRAFSLALPWVMLGAALGLNVVVSFVRRLAPAVNPAVLSSIVLVVLGVVAIPRTLDLVSAPNGMPSLVSYLGTHSASDVASTDGPILGFFIGEQHTNAKFRAAYINTPVDLSDLSRRYEFVAVEMQGYLFPNEVADRFLAAQPVFTAPHGNATWYLASLFENRGVGWGEWSDLLADWQRYRGAATELRLESLRALASQ